MRRNRKIEKKKKRLTVSGEPEKVTAVKNEAKMKKPEVPHLHKLEKTVLQSNRESGIKPKKDKVKEILSYHKDTPLEKKLTRNPAIDLLRGSAIIFMIITHVNSVFQKHPIGLLDNFTWWGATVCFTIFLFCFGYIHGSKLEKSQYKAGKTIIRVLKLAFIYYLTAIIACFFTDSQAFSIEKVIEIITFQTFIPYTEFLVSFLLYELFIYIFQRPIKGLLKLSPILLFIFALSFYFIGNYIYALDWGYEFLNPLKALLVGYEDWHTFGLLSYLPVLALGMIWGYSFNEPKEQKLHIGKININVQFVSLVLFIAGLLIMRFTDISTWYRFPPSPIFLLYGIVYSIIVLYYYPFLSRANDLRGFLIFLGKNSLEIFFWNVLVILGASWLINGEKFDDVKTIVLNFGAICTISLLARITDFIRVRVKPEQRGVELSITSPEEKVSTAKYYFFKKLLSMIITICAISLTFYVLFEDKINATGIGSIVTSTPPTNTNQTLCEAFKAQSDTMISSTDQTRNWYLLGNEFSPNEQTLNMEVILAENFRDYVSEDDEITISYEITGTDLRGLLNPDSTTVTPDGHASKYSKNVYIGDLAPGTYVIQYSSYFPCGTAKSEPKSINVSYPLYVVWSIDWEGYDVSQQYLDDMQYISTSHYNMPMSHFFSPYIYVILSTDRQDYLTNWVKNRQANYGDNIGVHIHAFPSLVSSAGVTPKENPEQWGTGFNDGYDVLVTNYDYVETVQILEWAKGKFAEHELNQPRIYRSGGWFADLETLQAVENTGFVLDSSGRTYTQFGTNSVAVPWNLAVTTSPYKPSLYDQNSSASPTFDIWEFPNNGGDSWWYTADQMIDRFNQNYSGSPLQNKQVVTFLSHPHWFYVDKPKLETLYGYTDNYVYNSDRGPVIYTTLENVYKIWSNNL